MKYVTAELGRHLHSRIVAKLYEDMSKQMQPPTTGYGSALRNSPHFMIRMFTRTIPRDILNEAVYEPLMG